MKRVMIYKGELTDAPGRDERWVESVTFLGDDQWKLEVDGTDFHGNSDGESWSDQFSTEGLVAWLDEQDSYLDDGEDEQKKPRLEALRVYAKKNGLDSTIRSIDKVTKKTPQPRLKVINVSEVALFPNGLHPRARKTIPYLIIQTTRGQGLMPIPRHDAKTGEYFLGTNFCSREWKTCRLTKELKRQIQRKVADYLEKKDKSVESSPPVKV